MICPLHCIILWVWYHGYMMSLCITSIVYLDNLVKVIYIRFHSSRVLFLSFHSCHFWHILFVGDKSLSLASTHKGRRWHDGFISRDNVHWEPFHKLHIILWKVTKWYSGRWGKNVVGKVRIHNAHKWLNTLLTKWMKTTMVIVQW